jgi:putative DNA primase/helicase
MGLDHRATQDLARQATAAASFDPPEWQRPEPLGKSSYAAPYPIESLPESIRPAVEEVARYVKAPVPLVAASALCAVSIAVQGLVNVRRSSGLVGPTSLYLLSVAESGARKSSCDGYFSQPIREFERLQQEAMKTKVAEYTARMSVFESMEAGIKDQLRQNGRKGEPIHHAERRLFELQEQKPTPPRIPRLVLTDATPEALAQRLQIWPSAGLVSSEAGVFFGSHGMGSETVMRNVTQLNVLWDGNPLTIDRKTSESISVRAARLSVGLQVQPATLDEFMRKNGSLARGSGFLARFLFAAPPSIQGSRFFEERPDCWPCLEKFQKRLSTLLALPLPMDSHGCLQPRELSLCQSARMEWIAYHDAVEKELAADGEFVDVGDIASKSADNAARISACFHLFDGADGDISEDNVRRGCAIALWHLYEARRFFVDTANEQGLKDASRLDSWLIRHCRTNQCLRVSRKDAMQFGPGATRKKEALQSALAELAALHRVRFNDAFIEVNPALLPMGQEAVQ